MRRTALLFIISLGLLAGCGFHLRGHIELPDSLKTIYVKAPQVELRDEIARALAATGATVVKDVTAQAAVIDIQRARYRREVRTVDERGKSTGYILFLDVDYLIKDRQGNVLVKRTRTSARRDYSFDINQALVAQRQEELLRQELREDVAQAILRRMARVR